MPEVDVDLCSDEIQTDPYPTYARLREMGPVLHDAPHDANLLPRYDEVRAPTDHLSFGRGAHRCLGANLAREEIKAVLDRLADRVAGLEVTERVWRRNDALLGLERLAVTVS